MNKLNHPPMRRDLIGERYGRLIVIRFNGVDKHRRACWVCRCDCGNETIQPTQLLSQGDSKSCGCLKAENLQRVQPKGHSHPEFKDITGQRFERLVVISYDYDGTHRWTCHCDCGNVVHTTRQGLTSGDYKSCGCFKRDTHTKHGHTRAKIRSPEFITWQAMLKRCNNADKEHFERYQARGIRVCEQWHAFENFYADMGPRPKGKTLDRIDNNGNYEPNNCRWATSKEQANNRS